MDKLVIASRQSALALWQSEYVKAKLLKHYPDMEIEIKKILTKGDKILDVPLAKIGGKGLFLKELEQAMLDGEAHIAVHSLKDVPTQMPEGLTLAAVTERADVRDMLLSDKYADIDSLPEGAVVGSSSLRRQMHLQHFRPDLKVKTLRGNVNTRINKLKAGEFDAIILAAAGIERLGLHDEVKHCYPIMMTEMIPAMGQAALGIQSVQDPEVLKMLECLNDEYSEVETTIERDFVDALEGGCQVPIGVNATLLENDDIIVRIMLGLPDGTEIQKATKIVKKENYKSAGNELAQIFIKDGARELLKRAEAMAFKDRE